ncbi:hypothetical protein BDN72DRAFT_835169 [Pluteus cervinus]|uniref:Uncharacterized protein n=1 Tax=Pluteus cervinus TaxID=181527 RepID=A0ACD3B5H7_9AGAR|nr:hypothetical protein BDN72DRAFT_835169 [Pluteus cervinus]
MSLLQLPLEILHTIVAYQDCERLKVLRQVCRILNQLVEPLLSSAITLTSITACYTPSPPFYELLEALANGMTNIGSHARSLSMMCLTRSLISNNANDKDHERNNEDKMRKWFLLALGSLKGVRCVSWVIDSSDPQGIQNGIIQWLINLPMLEELTLAWNSGISGDIRLDHISNLKKLHIEGTPQTLRDGLLQQVVSIISNSPKLVSLAVTIGGYNTGENKHLTFNSLFSMLPTSLPPLGLTEVISVAPYFPLCLDDAALRHLKGLKSLKLEGILHKDKNEEGASSWDKLRLHCIQLEELELTNVEDTALGYLASYSGLRALRFPDIDGSQATRVDQLATMFYTKVLPKHVETLEDLTLLSPFGSGWSFNAKYFDVLSQCKRLKTLHVAWEPDVAGAEDTLYSILDLSKTFPRLQSLTIGFAYPRSLRGRSNHGDPWGKYRQSYQTKVKKIFPEYKRVDIAKNLYMVQVDDLEFKIRRCQDTEGYQYNYTAPMTWKRGFLGA